MHSMPLNTGNHVPSACMMETGGVYSEPALYIYYSPYLRLTTRIPGSCLYTVVTPVQSLTFNFLSIREPGSKFVMSHCNGVNFEFVPQPHQSLSATNLVLHAYNIVNIQSNRYQSGQEDYTRLHAA